MPPSSGFWMQRAVEAAVVGEVMPFKAEDHWSEGLTPIHRRIYCAATPETYAPEYTETERVIIENFLNTLAEVAMAVVTRRSDQRENEPG